MHQYNAMSQVSDLDPQTVKDRVQDFLIANDKKGREDFILALELCLRRAKLNMRSYLIPLGIPGTSPENLTPKEIGHLLRFLLINVPTARPVIAAFIARYSGISLKPPIRKTRW